MEKDREKRQRFSGLRCDRGEKLRACKRQPSYRACNRRFYRPIDTLRASWRFFSPLPLERIVYRFPSHPAVGHFSPRIFDARSSRKIKALRVNSRSTGIRSSDKVSAPFFILRYLKIHAAITLNITLENLLNQSRCFVFTT